MKEFYMNDRISGDNHAIVLAGMCTALVVVLSLLGFYMPLLSTVVFLLIPLPIAYLGMKEGVKWSIVVTTGVLVLDSTFFGVVSAAFVCAIFGLLGVTMGICYRFKVSAAKTLIAGAVVVLLALVAEGIATLYLLGLPSLIFGSEGLSQIRDSMLETLPSFYSGEALDQAKEKVEFLMDAMENRCPIRWWLFLFSTPGLPWLWGLMCLRKWALPIFPIFLLLNDGNFQRPPWAFTFWCWQPSISSRIRSRCPMWLTIWAPSAFPFSGSRGCRCSGGCLTAIPS